MAALNYQKTELFPIFTNLQISAFVKYENPFVFLLDRESSSDVSPITFTEARKTPTFRSLCITDNVYGIPASDTPGFCELG
jgi:hypothetical protein